MLRAERFPINARVRALCLVAKATQRPMNQRCRMRPHSYRLRCPAPLSTIIIACVEDPVPSLSHFCSKLARILRPSTSVSARSVGCSRRKSKVPRGSNGLGQDFSTIDTQYQQGKFDFQDCDLTHTKVLLKTCKRIASCRRYILGRC